MLIRNKNHPSGSCRLGDFEIINYELRIMNCP